MIQGENSTVVQYELKKNNHPERLKNLRLEVRPLIAFRDYHSTTHENGAINRRGGAAPGTGDRHALSGIALAASGSQRSRGAESRRVGTGTLNMTPNGNAASISPKTFSILWSCVLIWTRVAQQR